MSKKFYSDEEFNIGFVSLVKLGVFEAVGVNKLGEVEYKVNKDWKEVIDKIACPCVGDYPNDCIECLKEAYRNIKGYEYNQGGGKSG